MKPLTILYWASTGVLAAFMLMASVPDILQVPMAVDVFRHLGYPTYLLPFIGTAKILGVGLVLVTASYAFYRRILIHADASLDVPRASRPGLQSGV
jgi:hypothetical protein